jgi:hypothetical protein
VISDQRSEISDQAAFSSGTGERRLAPVVLDAEAFVDGLFELLVLLDVDLAEAAVLAEEDGLEADEFEQGEEHGNDGVNGAGVGEEFGEGDGAVFHHEAAADEVDHLTDGDGVLFDVEDRAAFGALDDFAEDADEVEGVGGDFLIVFTG